MYLQESPCLLLQLFGQLHADTGRSMFSQYDSRNADGGININIQESVATRIPASLAAVKRAAAGAGIACAAPVRRNARAVI